MVKLTSKLGPERSCPIRVTVVCLLTPATVVLILCFHPSHYQPTKQEMQSKFPVMITDCQRRGKVMFSQVFVCPLGVGVCYPRYQVLSRGRVSLVPGPFGGGGGILYPGSGGHCGGWYASYWTAFLFTQFSVKISQARIHS